MDCTKTGGLIRALRREKGLTQLQLAEKLRVSDKAVSKWERGCGCPDVSLLPELSGILGVELEKLLSGELDVNDPVGGNMKNLKFYVCPDCGNITTASEEAAVYCCGKKLTALEAKKASDDERLSVERVENEFFVTSGHEMTKEHYISFVALLTGDTLVLKRLYPEWDLQTRLPMLSYGKLLWYCTRHGLYYQLLGADGGKG